MTVLDRFIRGITFLGRGALGSVAGNVGLFVLALAVAVSLWLFVVERENPQEAEAFSSGIDVEFVNVPANLAVANASQTSVRIRIEGPRNELADLTAADFDATVNLGGFDEGVRNVEVEVTPPNRRISVTDVTPRRIDVTLEPLRSKEVPVEVRLVGSPQIGFEATDTEVDPERVSVSGAASLVALVETAVAEVNLTALRADFTQDRVELHPRDVRGGAISRVTVNPGTASVRVRLEQREFSLSFTVAPNITGEPAEGHNITGINVSPALVTVTGPLEVLQSIDALRGISTEEISIADARSDVARSVQLLLPPDARVEGEPTIIVRVSIEAAMGQFTYDIVPQIRSVGSGLRATVAGPVRVTLSGPIPVLRQLSPDAITVVADAQGRDEGLHSLEIQVQAPAGTRVVGTEPETVGIALTRP
jgi:YbbR domain-containing protein